VQNNDKEIRDLNFSGKVNANIIQKLIFKCFLRTQNGCNFMKTEKGNILSSCDELTRKRKGNVWETAYLSLGVVCTHCQSELL